MYVSTMYIRITHNTIANLVPFTYNVQWSLSRTNQLASTPFSQVHTCMYAEKEVEYRAVWS